MRKYRRAGEYKTAMKAAAWEAQWVFKRDGCHKEDIVRRAANDLDLVPSYPLEATRLCIHNTVHALAFANIGQSLVVEALDRAWEAYRNDSKSKRAA